MPKALILIVIAFWMNAAQAESWRVSAQIIPSNAVNLRDASSISCSMDGWLYIADTGHNRIIAVDSTGALKAEVGGFGNSHGQFKWPRKVIADRGNAVWVLDYGNRRLEKYSRLLEYQGTFELRAANDDNPHQLGALAVSPNGDFYIYDLDDGRLAHLDPLFQLQSEWGGNSGAQVVSQISAMILLPSRGLFWWSRGEKHILSCDALLNRSEKIALPDAVMSVCLSESDSCLIVGAMSGLYRYCTLSPAWTVSPWPVNDFRSVSDLAFVSPSDLFILDGSSGAVYRLRKSEE
jgi:hypothetical protein